jgi:hypothetical protein
MKGLTKAKAKEFTKQVLGLSAALVKDDSYDGYIVQTGRVIHEFRIQYERIYLRTQVAGSRSTYMYFDIDTFEEDFKITEKSNEEDINEKIYEVLSWLKDDKKVEIPEKVMNGYKPKRW